MTCAGQQIGINSLAKQKQNDSHRHKVHTFSLPGAAVAAAVTFLAAGFNFPVALTSLHFLFILGLGLGLTLLDFFFFRGEGVVAGAPF
jgi:hypothetical protein